MRVILLTRGTGGDFYPFLQVGKALRGRGHEVIFMTHGHYGEKVRAAGLDFAPIDQPEDFESLLEQTPTNHFEDFVSGLAQGLPWLLTAYRACSHLFERKDTLLF